jgi:hypothetical protein
VKILPGNFRRLAVGLFLPIHRHRCPKPVDSLYALHYKVAMNTNWAEENLSLIRTLMERASIYRRALAPIMLTVGVIGTTASVAGMLGQLDAFLPFVFCWVVAAAVAGLAGFLLARRAALREGEAFWSPPTRRIALAMLPAWAAGIMATCVETDPTRLAGWWLVIYAVGLHGAGFFMPSGVRRLSWLFLLAGGVALGWKCSCSPHAVMGLGFGGLHLLYGIYLYATRAKQTSL